MSGGGPLVSIVIPCYRQAAYLPEAIESALAQDHAPVEVIVVDDGSPDGTSAVAARYPVACIRQPNRGLAGARNAGLRAARGEFVAFLDADDRLLPEAVRRGVEALRDHPEWALAFGGYRLISAAGVPEPEVVRPALQGDAYRWLLRHNWIGMHATVLYRRALLEAEGGFDEARRAAEDYDVYLRIARRHPMGGHAALIAEYRRHEGNMSSGSALMLREVLAVLDGQRAHVAGDRAGRGALRAGERAWRHEYVLALAREAGRALSERRDWRAAGGAVPVLLRHGPPVVALSVALGGARLLGLRRSPAARPVDAPPEER